MDVPEEYGGSGLTDFRYNMILNEELVRHRGVGRGLQPAKRRGRALHHRVWQRGAETPLAPQVCHGRDRHGDCHDRARHRQRPGRRPNICRAARGPLRRQRPKDLYHQRTVVRFVCGRGADESRSAARRAEPDLHRARSPRLRAAAKLAKVGMHAQDTAELFFTNCKVPVSNRLGDEGMGFYYLMQKLPQERMSIAVAAISGAEYCLDMTIEYCQHRKPLAGRSARFRTRASNWPK